MKQIYRIILRGRNDECDLNLWVDVCWEFPQEVKTRRAHKNLCWVPRCLTYTDTGHVLFSLPTEVSCWRVEAEFLAKSTKPRMKTCLSVRTRCAVCSYLTLCLCNTTTLLLFHTLQNKCTIFFTLMQRSVGPQASLFFVQFESTI